MQMNRGKLVVSTKADEKGRKVAIIFGGGFLIILAIILEIALFTKNGLAKDMAKDLLGNSSLSWIFQIFPLSLFGYACFNLIVVFLGSKSYCDVYEYAVEGMTALSRTNPNSPMQHFEIQYQDIANITESGKMLCIYTQYTTYEVLAMRNRAEALKEIRMRMTGGKNT